MGIKDSRMLKPEEIEAESFRIIEMEAGDHDWPDDQWQIVRRIIHTSADFEYLGSMVITPDAIPSAISAIKAGRGIVTDTKMAMAGIRKDLAAGFGNSISCHVSDPEVARSAKEAGLTRSVMAMRHACAENLNGIFVIGNAPTALFELIELVKGAVCRPALVIALPVGFVGAEESKNLLASAGLNIPFITNMGRKGGSNVAAAAVNALLLMAESER